MNRFITLIALALTSLLINPDCHAQDHKDSTFHFNQVIKNGENNRLNIHQPLDILKAQTIGVSFTKKGSDPTVFNSINIRGKATGFEPAVLYIIDGIIGADPAMLLPDDIESIEIIRDGAQLTAYGTQGNSGVVIIKTRQYAGTKKISVNFSSFVTMNSTAKKLDLLSADQFRETASKYDMNLTDGGASTDWQEEIMRKTISQVYRLGITGKLNNTLYDLSAFFHNNPGITLRTARKNNGANLKIRHFALEDKLILYTNLAYNSSEADLLPTTYNGINFTNEIFFQTLTHNPTDPVYEPDGITFHQSDRAFRYSNPLKIIDAVTKTTSTDNLRLNAGANYSLMKGLEAGINIGYSNLTYDLQYNQPPEALNHNTDKYSSTSHDKYSRINAEAKVSYSRKFNGSHEISFGGKIGYRDLKNETESTTQYQPLLITYNYNENRKYTNFILDAGYNYKQRYYAGALANIESSQLVISGIKATINQLNRKKFYPSLVAGWKVSNETFLMKSNIISNLFIRGSYGIRGNGNADKFMFYADFPGIDALKTEKITEVNVALDFGLLKNKITGTLGFFNRKIGNAVGFQYLPTPPNIHPYTFSNSEVYNGTGIELTICVKAMEKDNFNWYSQANLYTVRDELKEANFRSSEGTPINAFFFNSRFYNTQLIRTGYPSKVFYLPASAGYSEDGRPLFYTKTGTITREIELAKFEVMSQTDPKFSIGWVNSFNVLKSFDISVSMSYAGGFSIYNATRMYLSNPFLIPTHNISEEGLENLEAGYETSPILSELYLEDASYLRIDDITLSYTFKCKKMNDRGQFKVFASAGNILTITDYTGYDPAGDSDGVDYFDVYPLAKTYTLGVKFDF